MKPFGSLLRGIATAVFAVFAVVAALAGDDRAATLCLLAVIALKP